MMMEIFEDKVGATNNDLDPASSDKKRAKRARKEAVAENLQRIISSTTVRSETTVECFHEVAVPESYNYTPMSETRMPLKMAREYRFALDPFQNETIRCIERMESVLVSAHTAAGKTVCAEYAIAKCLKNNQRVIYTSPIKALSNQKYRELQEEFVDVGLITGDVTIDASATCLVMTTEILRSMLYRGSEALRDVGWIIFDEVHYMRDKERGVVWEEVMILLPDSVHFMFLSATIPNAIQFARWICYLHRQPCHIVYTDYRPTPLQHYLFPSGGDGLHLTIDARGVFREDSFSRAMAMLRDTSHSDKKKGRKEGMKGPSDIVRIIKLAVFKNLAPVLVFSFSKRSCEEHAVKLAAIDMTTDDEKELIHKTFSAAVDILSEEDRKLAQVEHILPFLRRGIGIHHGGLLPLLKEVTEVLFAKGLLKVLFATETFAMGLNMPAKTVIFAQARKFDGKEHRWLTSGEYIQMSGRAGRRGLDDKGSVILVIDEKVEPSFAKGIFNGQANTLDSAFRLTYNMILNMMCVEDMTPEDVLEKSFLQFQTQEALPELEAKLKYLESEKDAIAIEAEENVEDYCRSREQLEKLDSQLQQILTEPKYAVPFLNSGRLIHVKDEGIDWGWGVVVNFSYKSVPTVKAHTNEYIVEALLCHTARSEATKSKYPSPPSKHSKGELGVLPLKLDRISKFSSIRLSLPHDLRSPDARLSVQKMMSEVHRKYPRGVPLLDPKKDMNITDDELDNVISKIRDTEKKYYQHVLHKSKDAESQLELFAKKQALATEIKVIKKQIKKSKNVQKFDELKARKRVLRKLKYANSEDIVQLKGKVACCITSGDELVLTELLCGGFFSTLDVPQCVALATCFVFDERADDPSTPTEALATALRTLLDTAHRIAKVSIDCKLPIDEEEYVNGFSREMMQIGYAWANGSKFQDICKMTDIYEGSIVRVMRRLEELLNELCIASKVLGNAELENKFTSAIAAINRDVVFAASLYL